MGIVGSESRSSKIGGEILSVRSETTTFHIFFKKEKVDSVLSAYDY
jgi:hypothetical protein